MPDVPDIYADAFNMSCSPYGVTMSFYVLDEATDPGDKGMKRRKVLTLRMSLEHAKAQAMIMHKHLKEFETNILKTPIPVISEPSQP